MTFTTTPEQKFLRVIAARNASSNVLRQNESAPREFFSKENALEAGRDQVNIHKDYAMAQYTLAKEYVKAQVAFVKVQTGYFQADRVAMKGEKIARVEADKAKVKAAEASVTAVTGIVIK